MSEQNPSVESLPEAQRPEHFPDYIDVVDPEPWFGLVGERFGIPAEVFDPYLLHRPNSRALNIVSVDHRPTLRPEAEAVGMRFIRYSMQHPKLTTTAAMAFGRAATRNAVSLSADEIDRFVSRQRVELSAKQVERCTDTGYVLVSHRQVVVGVGLFFEDPVGGRLRSMFPKAWSVDEQTSIVD